MNKRTSSKEKQRYWEGRLWDLLQPIPVVDLLKLCWSIEAFRDGRKAEALKHASLPGEPEDHKIPGKYFIPPWNLDGVLNEQLRLNLTAEKNTKYLNLSNWGSIAKLLNVYNGLSNAESVMDYASNEIMSAIPRLFWPQYEWQIGFENIYRIGRAWHVYATPEGKKAFKEKHEIELERFLWASFAAYAATASYPAVKPEYLMKAGATRAELYYLMRALGGNIGAQSNLAREFRNKEIPRDFQRSVVKERPFFEVVRGASVEYFVPFRSYLLLRITDGLYYDIVSDDNARRSSGEKFEDLCHKLIVYYCGSECTVEQEKATSYGKSADLFMRFGNNEIMIECKIRRIPQRILTSPKPWDDCEEDYSDVIKGIVQIWRTHQDLAAKETTSVGIVLQFDPWTIMGNAFLKELFQRAHQKADSIGVPEDSRVPVALVGYSDFERCIRSYTVSDIHDAVSKAAEEGYHGYELAGVLNDIAEKSDHNGKQRFDYNAIAKLAVPWWGEE